MKLHPDPEDDAIERAGSFHFKKPLHLGGSFSQNDRSAGKTKRGIKWRGTSAVKCGSKQSAWGESRNCCRSAVSAAVAPSTRMPIAERATEEEDGAAALFRFCCEARAETLTPKGEKGGDRARKLSNE